MARRETELTQEEWAFHATIGIQRENLELRRALLDRQERDYQAAIAARLNADGGRVAIDLQRRLAFVEMVTDAGGALAAGAGAPSGRRTQP